MKMKNLKFLAIILFLSAAFMVSCTKESDNLGISYITYYADFDYEPLVAIPVGGTFTPGAVVTEKGNPIDYTIDGSSDPSTIGIYEYYYSATNSDGYSSTVTQVIAVYNPTGAGTDVSGKIEDIGRPERKATISLVEGTPNIYYCTDMAYSGTFPLYFEMNGDVMNVIPQNFAFDQTEVIASYDPGSRTFHVEVYPDGYVYDFKYSN